MKPKSDKRFYVLLFSITKSVIAEIKNFPREDSDKL